MTDELSPEQQAAPAPKAPKPKERSRMESTEVEVDRIIDSQDNEYVLSKPK